MKKLGKVFCDAFHQLGLHRTDLVYDDVQTDKTRHENLFPICPTSLLLKLFLKCTNVYRNLYIAIPYEIQNSIIYNSIVNDIFDFHNIL